ncbi:MAG TPA: LysE family transporter [Candidatus Limnocylindrales bacterium]|nr:LysE family transporter [Candidatus Limnocylindrales bacterium]
MAALVSGLIAGYGVAIPIGAIAPLLMSLTARTSLKVGAAAALGVATADGVYALVAVLGGASLARFIEPIALPLRVVAVAILLFIAARIAIGAFREPSAEVRNGFGTPIRAYTGLLGLTLLNPTTILYFGALVLGWQAAGTATGAPWVVGVVVASASWQLLLAGGGVLIGRTLNTPRGRRWTSLISSVMIATLALAVIVG